MAATSGVLTAELAGVCSRAINRVPVGSAINSGFRSSTTGCTLLEVCGVTRSPDPELTNTSEALVSFSTFGAGMGVMVCGALEETEFCSKRSLWAQDEGLEVVGPGHRRKTGLLALTS